jgi:uncharacterized sodium:solute symporter family permease YidK
MNLSDLVTRAANGAAAKIRRQTILYSLCALFAVAAMVLATMAAVLALEPYMGLVYAQLIIAGVYVVAVLIVVLMIRHTRTRHHPVMTFEAEARASVEPPQPAAHFSQIAMIVEAVMLGYALSRRSDRR